MGHPSTPQFQTFHSLRIKGFATVDTLVEMTAQPAVVVQGHLDALVGDGRAQFREARALWQLTPDGRKAHGAALDADLAGFDAAALSGGYEAFLEINGAFKELCGDWQLRDGAINDHTDHTYDAGVLDRLADLHQRAEPVVTGMAGALERFGPYPTRLVDVVARVRSGETNLFTGVMCGSYHDVWMELHEDLILTQRIDRTAEGSF